MTPVHSFQEEAGLNNEQCNEKRCNKKTVTMVQLKTAGNVTRFASWHQEDASKCPEQNRFKNSVPNGVKGVLLRITTS